MTDTEAAEVSNGVVKIDARAAWTVVVRQLAQALLQEAQRGQRELVLSDDEEVDDATLVINYGNAVDLAGALMRIRDGTYGLCAECMRRIPKGRLMALPTTPYCIPCKTETEHSGDGLVRRGQRPSLPIPNGVTSDAIPTDALRDLGTRLD